jgi:hypothetical protein
MTTGNLWVDLIVAVLGVIASFFGGRASKPVRKL